MTTVRAKPKDRRERLQYLISDIRDETFEYQPRPDKQRDWARYDEAQAHERADVLNLIRTIIDNQVDSTPPKTPGRPPIYMSKDKAKAVLVQTYLQASNRVTTGDCRLFREKLGLGRPMPYKTVERAYSDPNVQGLILNAFATTVRLATQNATGYTLDGSGIPTTIKGNWERDKSESKTNASSFDGAITMIALPVGAVVAFLPRRIGFQSEVDQLGNLVDLAVLHGGDLRGIVSADAGFQSRVNCEKITHAGGIPRIFPSRNVTRKTLGAPSWTRMLNDLERNPQKWLEEYHLRSLAETSWSVYGALFVKPLRRRLAPRRSFEHVARFVVYNLVRISRAYRHGDLPTAEPLIRGMLN